jgi:hypothetical protein
MVLQIWYKKPPVEYRVPLNAAGDSVKMVIYMRSHMQKLVLPCSEKSSIAGGLKIQWQVHSGEIA